MERHSHRERLIDIESLAVVEAVNGHFRRGFRLVGAAAPNRLDRPRIRASGEQATR